MGPSNSLHTTPPSILRRPHIQCLLLKNFPGGVNGVPGTSLPLKFSKSKPWRSVPIRFLTVLKPERRQSRRCSSQGKLSAVKNVLYRVFFDVTHCVVILFVMYCVTVVSASSRILRRFSFDRSLVNRNRRVRVLTSSFSASVYRSTS
ncbi:hypothetical protein OG21DRAFT_209794 [Imleria badia]|nr:hypothetical protein OG21DRAFT_209794 [Imleria badia]